MDSGSAEPGHVGVLGQLGENGGREGREDVFVRVRDIAGDQEAVRRGEECAGDALEGADAPDDLRGNADVPMA